MHRKEMYNTKYGRNRLERAWKMANNIAPAGERLPRVRNYKVHIFNNRCVYLTDIDENKVFCKSQKWFKRNKVYTIRIRNNRTISCTCKDIEKCKHRLCVEMNYHELRTPREVRILRV